jgi:hypothetical protein
MSLFPTTPTRWSILAFILLSTVKSPTDEPLNNRNLQKLNHDGDQVSFDTITDCVYFLTTKADFRVFANETSISMPYRSHRWNIGNAASTHHLKSTSYPRQRRRMILRLHASGVETSTGAKIAHI